MTPVDANADTVALGALASPTPAAWAHAQVGNVGELLVDQAHLEKKAAAAAVALLFRLPGDPAVHRELSALAREELVHFERTLRLLVARGIPFGPLPPSGYAERLKAAISPAMPLRLADELLVAGIIEARSGERMALLAAALRASDAEVAAFYAEWCAAEARHHSLYVDLGAAMLPAPLLAQRWDALARHEAHVLRELPFTKRLHGGVARDG